MTQQCACFRFILVLFGLLAGVAPAWAVTVHPYYFSGECGPTVITNGALVPPDYSSTFSEPAMANNGTGVVVLAANHLDPTNNNVRVFRSTDGGSTFDSGTSLFDFPGYAASGYDQSADPVVLFHNGRFFVAAVAFSDSIVGGTTTTPGDDPNCDGATQDCDSAADPDGDTNGLDCTAPNGMLFSTSIDGITWTPLQTLTNGGATMGDGYLHDRPWMAGDPETGRLWAVWTGYPGNPCGGSYGDQHTQYSDDNGATWSAPIRITLNNYITYGTVLAMQNELLVPLVWDDGVHIFRVAFNPSGTPFTYQTTSVPSLPGSAPSLSDHTFLPGLQRTRLNSSPTISRSPDGTRLVMVWMERDALGVAHVMSAFADTNIQYGGTWSAPIALQACHGGPIHETFLPTVGWDAQGRPVACFYERHGTMETRTNDALVEYNCALANNITKTWQCRWPWEHTIQTHGSLYSGSREFLGDYTAFTGKLVAFTSLRAAQNGSDQPHIQLRKVPTACQLDPAAPLTAWPMLLPLLLFILRLLAPLPAAATQSSCIGDCNGDRRITIAELVTGVNVELGNATVEKCPSIDCNTTGGVQINCLIAAVRGALASCEAEALVRPRAAGD